VNSERRALLVGGAAVATFLITAVVLGTAVLFAVVVFLIGPHGGGILPEWSHLPVLAVCAAGVGYVSFKAAIWTQAALVRMSAI
jgi:hypothetical protein